MAVHGAVVWFVLCDCDTCISWSDSFCLNCNQNRSAHLCKLVNVNSLLAVNSVNFCTSHPQAVVRFRTAVEHLHLTNMRFILHPLLISCMRLGCNQALSNNF